MVGFSFLAGVAVLVALEEPLRPPFFPKDPHSSWGLREFRLSLDLGVRIGRPRVQAAGLLQGIDTPW